MDENKWADAKVREIQARREQRSLEKQHSIQVRDLKTIHAPELWRSVQTLLESRAKLLKERLGDDNIYLIKPALNETRIRFPGSPNDLGIFFDPRTLALRCDLISSSTRYEPQVSEGQVAFCIKTASQWIPYSPEQIVDDFMEHVATQVY